MEVFVLLLVAIQAEVLATSTQYTLEFNKRAYYYKRTTTSSFSIKTSSLKFTESSSAGLHSKTFVSSDYSSSTSDFTGTKTTAETSFEPTTIASSTKVAPRASNTTAAPSVQSSAYNESDSMFTSAEITASSEYVANMLNSESEPNLFQFEMTTEVVGPTSPTAVTTISSTVDIATVSSVRNTATLAAKATTTVAVTAPISSQEQTIKTAAIVITAGSVAATLAGIFFFRRSAKAGPVANVPTEDLDKQYWERMKGFDIYVSDNFSKKGSSRIPVYEAGVAVGYTYK